MAKLVTFDCYGTLVDFNLGQAAREQLGSRLEQHNLDVEQFLHDYYVIRFQACLVDYMPYEKMLHVSLEHAMKLHGLPYKTEDGDAMVDWARSRGPFPEVPAALEKLKEKYQIGIISNSDDNILRYNVENIGVEFDYVVTAEQVQAYKPKREAFLKAWEKMGATPEEVIHTAQGWEYDIMPTYPLGVERRVWINRSKLPGSNDFQPYDELSDLEKLPETLGISG